MTGNVRTEFARQLALAREQARAEAEQRAREAEARRIETQRAEEARRIEERMAEEARAKAREERQAARNVLLSEFLYEVNWLSERIHVRKLDQPSSDEVWAIAVEGPRSFEQQILITSSDDVAHLGITFLPDRTFSSLEELRAHLYGDFLARIAWAVAYQEAEVRATQQAVAVAGAPASNSEDEFESVAAAHIAEPAVTTMGRLEMEVLEFTDKPVHVADPAAMTVGRFAAVLRVPAERLVEQLHAAGLGKLGVDDVVTNEMKLNLLTHLRREHGRA